jgi:hypothetical protein
MSADDSTSQAHQSLATAAFEARALIEAQPLPPDVGVMHMSDAQRDALLELTDAERRAFDERAAERALRRALYVAPTPLFIVRTGTLLDA